MKSTIAAFAIAFIISALLTPWVRRVAVVAGAIDESGADDPHSRRVHAGRIPRMGGVAVAIAFFVPLVVLLLLDSSLAHQFFHDPRRIVGLGLGGAIVLALGVVDDIRGVRPRTKLVFQATAALVAWGFGYDIHAVALPLIGRVEFGAFSLVITIFWFVGVINALNLIDGLDGLAAGIAFFACITNLVVGTLNDSLLVILLSGALSGALLGFLIYNFNPASIFMGDSGSMFLGFVLAATSLLGSTIKSSTTVAILVPIVALGVPITDTVWTFARRLKQRRSIFVADRGHIHHRLLDLGLSQRRVVMLLYGFSVALTVAAVGFALRSLAAGGALIIMGAMLVGVVRTSRSFNLQRGNAIPQRPRLPLVEELRRKIPTALREFDGQLTVDAARGLLTEFVHSVGLAGYVLELPECLPDAALESEGGPAQGQVAKLEYPLSVLDEHAQLRFWLSDSHKDDQVHVLLQLVADAVAQSLLTTAQRARVRSMAQTNSALQSSSQAVPTAAGKASPV